MEIGLTGLVEEREFVAPQVGIVAIRVRITADMPDPRRLERKKIGPERRFICSFPRPSLCATAFWTISDGGLAAIFDTEFTS